MHNIKYFRINIEYLFFFIFEYFIHIIMYNMYLMHVKLYKHPQFTDNISKR